VTDAESLSALRSRAPSARLAGGYEPRSPAELSGEHRLVLAILEDAIALYVKSLSEGAVAQHEARGARVWLKSRDRSSPFAFESICDLLGLDSDYIRRGLRTVCARPAEVAARLAVRHHGRPSGPAPPPRTAPGVAPRVAVTDVALAERASVAPAGGRLPPPAPAGQASAPQRRAQPMHADATRA
jgi:hypothetical protein